MSGVKFVTIPVECHAHLSVCFGHTFCNSCLKNVKKLTVLSDACPMCRSNQFTTVPNKQNERTVLNLKVLCTI